MLRGTGSSVFLPQLRHPVCSGHEIANSSGAWNELINARFLYRLLAISNRYNKMTEARIRDTH